MTLLNRTNYPSWPLLTFRLFRDVGIATGQSRSSDANVGVKGRYIVAVSDADMAPTACIDGHGEISRTNSPETPPDRW